MAQSLPSLVFTLDNSASQPCTLAWRLRCVLQVLASHAFGVTMKLDEHALRVFRRILSFVPNVPGEGDYSVAAT